MDSNSSDADLKPLNVENEIRDIKYRLNLYEGVIAFAFAVSFTLVDALIKIMGIEIYYSNLAPYGVFFFCVSFLSIQFIWYAIKAIEKAGGNLKVIARKIREDWKTEKTLNRLIILLGLPSSLFALYKF